MVEISIIPCSVFQRINAAPIDRWERLALLADMCRLNALATVKHAGSGHLGSSFSSLDIVTYLYYAEMNTAQVGIQHPDRDIYFSSKGHDVPGLYAVLYALGILPEEKFLRLRRLGGTAGHPDVSIPGIEANSGSLGMGISKGKGIALAKQLLGRQGRVFVLTGDGEWQEGQNFEALQAARHQGANNLTVIVDHNKVQSDKPVAEILDLGDLEAKFRAFGWYVARCDGHDFRALENVFRQFDAVTDQPKLLIADTLKGRGVSFMEHPAALQAGQGLYRWHAGAPDDASFTAAFAELRNRIEARLAALGLTPLELKPVPSEKAHFDYALLGSSLTIQNALGEPVSQAAQRAYASTVSDEYVVEAFGQALVEIAAERPDLVVLDADLASDCRLRAFEAKYPERFIENGIAEQDMVSTAGGLARQGLLPVVNSFAAFLAARANEQIYNNACERSRIIYVCHYAGLIPAGPGNSHQSIRDISLLGALPNFVILEPCNAWETRQALRYCVHVATDNCVLRLVIGPSPRKIQLPADYVLHVGRGAVLRAGRDALLFGYGPVMLHEALLAAERLAEQNVEVGVVNLPWLNRIDVEWLRDVVADHTAIYVLDDHSPVGGLGDALLNALVAQGLLNGRRFAKLAVTGFPVWGTPAEALWFHGLDGASLATRILRDLDPSAPPHSMGG